MRVILALFITNQFIHGGVIYPYRDETRNWAGLLTCSDYEKENQIGYNSSSVNSRRVEGKNDDMNRINVYVAIKISFESQQNIDYKSWLKIRFDRSRSTG